MTVQTRTESISAPDGAGSFDAHVALPPAGTGPGLLVIQEIFGVTHYIRRRCADLAQLGYVAMAPDAFWRIEPNIEIGDSDADLQRAIGLGGQFDADKGIPDLCAALAHLRTLPETQGHPCGVLGYCFGGTMAFAVACHADPDVAVAYYGSGIPSMLELGQRISCPVQFHFGTRDAYIPAEAIAAVADFAAKNPAMEHHEYDAGHAFDNVFHPLGQGFESVQAQAWHNTCAFLDQHMSST